MIGNDIVDLNLAAIESNWRRSRYLEKLFTTSERFLIAAATAPEIMVWLLWTMKESAYKARAAEIKLHSFAPTLLACDNLVLHQESASGRISYLGQTYYSQSTIAPAYIHTIAAEETETINRAITKIDNYDAADDSYRYSNPISVSHHGNYLALIYL